MKSSLVGPGYRAVPVSGTFRTLNQNASQSNIFITVEVIVFSQVYCRTTITLHIGKNNLSILKQRSFYSVYFAPYFPWFIYASYPFSWIKEEEFVLYIVPTVPVCHSRIHHTFERSVPSTGRLPVVLTALKYDKLLAF